MIPFFFMLAFGDMSDPSNGMETLTLSMVASVAASVSGLMTGGLYLFLKSNTLSTIGPNNKAGEYERERIKHTIRRAASGDPDNNDHTAQPVRAPGDLPGMDSDSNIINNEMDDDDKTVVLGIPGSPAASSRYDSRNPKPSISNAVYPRTTIPQAPEAAQLPSTSGIGHTRKRSYSLFPNNRPSAKSSATLLPSTAYSPSANPRSRDAQAALDSLKPPPSLRNIGMGRHRRDSSMVSSATVQIGLRLSSVEDMPTPPATAIQTTDPDLDVLGLGCPKEGRKIDGKRPSPLNTATTTAEVDTEVAAPWPLVAGGTKRDPVKDARMKTLPPVPRTGEVVNDAKHDDGDDDDKSRYEEEETLSPAVYNSSPVKKKPPSPETVGFTLPQSRFNTGSPRNPPGKAPPRRGTGDSPTPPAATKSDWI